jgi:phage RecT family recombinase
MKEAWLKLRELKDGNGDPALASCTRGSICSALLDMAVQGLSPGKGQCYFIAYKNQVRLRRSYLGTVAVARRVGGVKDVFAQPIYAKDSFEIEMGDGGEIESYLHESSFANIDMDAIVGAYAVVVTDDGHRHITVMTIDQIRKAWAMNLSATGKKSAAYEDFPDEMAKKTVISRALKYYINSSDDTSLLAAAYNRADEPAALEGGRESMPKANAAMNALLFGPEEEAGHGGREQGSADERRGKPSRPGGKRAEGEPEEGAGDGENAMRLLAELGDGENPFGGGDGA